jgi:DNA polymerase III gamma/tau subunit
VPASKIAERLKFIFRDNGYTFDEEGVNLIANAGQGSVRDALSVADMCVSYSGGDIKYQSVLDVLGASDPQKIAGLAEAIASGDVDSALNEVAKMCELGKSVPILASDLATFFRNILYIKTCKNAKQLLSIPDTTYALLAPMAEKYSVSKCMTIMKAMNGLEGEFRYSTQHRILLEGAIVSCAAGAEANDNAKIKELEAKVLNLEKKLKALVQSGFRSTPVKLDAKQVWQKMASMLSEKGQHILALAVPEATITFDDKEVFVEINSKATYDILTEKNNREILSQVFATQCDLPLVIKYVAKQEEDSTLPYIKSMFGGKLEIK